jgi:hypothetical protein
MKDWAGILFFVLLFAGALYGLHKLANPPKRTSEDFERAVGEAGTALGAAGSALQDLLQPQHGRARLVVEQMKEGRFQKKRREGKASDDRET